MDKNFKVGEQVARIPSRAEGDITHSSVEYGFVAATREDDAVFCRYFYRTESGIRNPPLRTKANSELTPTSILRRHLHTSQDYVNGICEAFGYKSKVC